MLNDTADSKTDIERLNAVLRMIAYSIEEAKYLDAALLKYTLEVALSAGIERVKEANKHHSFGTSGLIDLSIFVPQNN